MNLEESEKLREPLKALLESASRINLRKPQPYWYPLSVASYDLEEVLAAVDSMCSFRTSMWEKTEAFELSFAQRVGAPEAVMVNSGSSADLLIAFALVNPATDQLKAGDEVLVPAVTWPTQVWALMMAGLSPVLVDADPTTLNVDFADLESKITDRVRAISIVHLMGNPCNMDRLQELAHLHDLVLVEDCCEALGARWDGQPVGSFGRAASFSFFFSHHMTTMEGGMICCADQSLSDLFRLLRAHGWTRDTRYMDLETVEGLDPRYTFVNWGFNVRPTELQAAFGIEQLKRLPAFEEMRSANAAYFATIMKRFPFFEAIRVLEDAEPCWFALPIMVAEEAPFTRQELTTFLESNGIETRPIVTGSLARHPVRHMFPALTGDLPGADAVHENGFYIGLHPFDMTEKLDRFGEVVDDFVARRS